MRLWKQPVCHIACDSRAIALLFNGGVWISPLSFPGTNGLFLCGDPGHDHPDADDYRPAVSALCQAGLAKHFSSADRAGFFICSFKERLLE